MAIIGFLGLGRMGAGMAGRLLDAGHRVTVYNRSADKARALADRGALVAGTPREAAADADAVFAMVADDEASRAVWTGADGALAGALASQALVVECSTLSHAWVGTLAGAAEAQGARYADCPVTGLPDAAAAGTLTLFVGAAPETLEAARPLLASLAQEIVHFGPVGAGTAYKLMINLMGSIQIAAAAEGLAIAEKAGLDLGLVAEVLAKGQAASPQVVRNSRRMADGNHGKDIVFSGRLRLKDTLYGLALAQAVGQSTPLGDAAARAFHDLVEAGLGDSNESRVFEILKRRP
jgi:3-hydroxyisobutyrate dehydrogenase